MGCFRSYRLARNAKHGRGRLGQGPSKDKKDVLGELFSWNLFPGPPDLHAFLYGRRGHQTVEVSGTLTFRQTNRPTDRSKRCCTHGMIRVVRLIACMSTKARCHGLRCADRVVGNRQTNTEGLNRGMHLKCVLSMQVSQFPGKGREVGPNLERV